MPNQRSPRGDDPIAYNVTVTVTILLFAGAAERAGTRRLEIPSEPDDTVERVRDRVVACRPAIAPLLPTLLYALNEEYVKPSAAVSPGDTLAFIPPVSGG